MTAVRRLAFALLLAVPIGFLGLASVGNNARSEIVSKVRREAEPEPAAIPKPSQAMITLDIPFRKIEAVLNLYEFAFKSNGRLAGFASYDTVLTLDRISLARSPDAPTFFRVTAPFTLRGKVGGFDLHEAGSAAIDLAFAIGDDWCPLVQIGAASVALKDKVRPAALMPASRTIGDFVATTILKQELETALECTKLRTGIAELWRSDYFTILSRSKKLVMNLDPQFISLSRMTIEQDRMRLTGLIKMIATVGTSSQRASRRLPSPAILSGGSTQSGSEVEMILSLVPEIGKR